MEHSLCLILGMVPTFFLPGLHHLSVHTDGVSAELIEDRNIPNIWLKRITDIHIALTISRSSSLPEEAKGATSPNCTLSAAGSLKLAPPGFRALGRRPLKLKTLHSPMPVRAGLVAAAHFGDS